MTTQEKAIATLNELIEISRDGEKGFKAAAEKADDPGLKSLLQERARSCAGAAGELKSLVRSLGAEPADSGTVAGAVHRGWVKLRAVVGDNNIAVLEEVERGEDLAKDAYARALKNQDLPPDIRQTLDQQFQGVLRNHDRVRELRNQYRASSH
jgi:uncharacterized protein (TIGR02284 family)